MKKIAKIKQLIRCVKMDISEQGPRFELIQKLRRLKKAKSDIEASQP